MPTDVVMPQMGESIAEGTIVRWIKKVGETVERDEPLFEISTDKVDAEIPAPAAGVVAEIRVKEGETVGVNTIVAVIGDSGVASAPGPTAAPVAATRTAPSPVPQPAAVTPLSPAPAPPLAAAGPSSKPQVARQRSSPLVRRIAREHNVDISGIPGTGLAGRVSKHDILAFIGQGGLEAQGGQSAESSGQARAAAPVMTDRVEKMSVMRKKIAEHMVASRRTSAHVHSVFEVNFSRVAAARDVKAAEYQRAGAKLTFLSFILKAATTALQAVPVLNASIDGDTVVYHKEINVGIAVALDWGLIVPVVKNAAEKNLLDLSRAVADLAGRARAKQLKPDEVSGGTFTITNPGVFGALFGMPIINQPQVAILGIGHIEKRPVVIDDAIAIRPMAYLTLGYDHRLIDGSVADEFMSHLKHTLENWDPKQV
nr:dihydrolipoyllysine-residue succinyltransferase component of 2-oxoglutarate dehydrogenase complex [uncultured bacterium]